MDEDRNNYIELNWIKQTVRYLYDIFLFFVLFQMIFMHNYQTRFHLVRSRDILQLTYPTLRPYVFTETIFMAVTACQKEKMLLLTIKHSHFCQRIF